MSAATNYELNDAATVGPSFITSEEATLWRLPELVTRQHLSVLSCRTGTLSFVLPNGFFAIEKMRRTPFRPHFSMRSAI